MLYFFKFTTALKSSWIRRFIKCKTKWKNLLKTVINEKVNSLWLNRTDFIEDISKSFQNIFWKDIFVVGLKY